jgi:hypothetical protein
MKEKTMNTRQAAKYAIHNVAVLACLGAAFVSTAFAEDVVLTLGTREEVTKLFSWPNCKEHCAVVRDLPETVQYYLEASAKRDGFTGTSFVITEHQNKILVTVSGPAAKIYKARIPKFLSAGAVGEAAAEALQKAGQWRKEWRFFLPLGLAFTNNPTVELLHFPPTSVLEATQDYLAAHTTKRWADLLVRNGADKSQTDRYQAIIDIAPVAAPADGGPNLSGVYDDFTPYTKAMMAFWLPSSDPNLPRPMVVFGGPVRDWIEENFGRKLAVSDTAMLDMPNVGTVPVIASNHPSMLYNAADQYRQPNGEPTDKGLRVLSKVMHQDLVAACWQVRMGAAPASDSKAIATSCINKWTGKPKELCKMVAGQAFNLSEARQNEVCANFKSDMLSEISDADVEKLSRQLNL